MKGFLALGPPRAEAVHGLPFLFPLGGVFGGATLPVAGLALEFGEGEFCWFGGGVAGVVGGALAVVVAVAVVGLYGGPCDGADFAEQVSERV